MRLSPTKYAATVACAVLIGLAPAPPPAYADDPPDSTVITGSAEDHNTVHSNSDGDLWAGCQSDDGAFYAANGDGTGFDRGHKQDKITEDIVVNRIPDAISIPSKNSRLMTPWNLPGRSGTAPASTASRPGCYAWTARCT